MARELGLRAPLFPAVWFGLFCSAPTLIGFALTRRFSPSGPLLAILFLTVFSPIIEEIEYRGFGVRHLQRATVWPFWIVVWPSAILFGWGHIEHGQNWQEMAGIFLLTGTGGLVFAWLLARWENLWFPIMLHIAMNLWWELFSVARTVIGGWFPFALQTLTIVLAIAVTLRFTHEKQSKQRVIEPIPAASRPD
jgi:membrane protease YdiL (CAAX protease family)